MTLNESTVEAAALEWFEALGYAVAFGPDIAPGERKAERDSFGEVVQSRFAGTLTRPLPWGEEKREAIRRLNPAIPEEARSTDKESLSVQNTSKRC